MKKLMAVFVLALIASCSLPIPQIEPEPGEVLISGIWGGWVIEAGGMLFQTPIGIRTIGYHVQIVEHYGQWYRWDNGYGMRIEKE